MKLITRQNYFGLPLWTLNKDPYVWFLLDWQCKRCEYQMKWTWTSVTYIKSRNIDVHVHGMCHLFTWSFYPSSLSQGSSWSNQYWLRWRSSTPVECYPLMFVHWGFSGSSAHFHLIEIHPPCCNAFITLLYKLFILIMMWHKNKVGCLSCFLYYHLKLLNMHLWWMHKYKVLQKQEHQKYLSHIAEENDNVQLSEHGKMWKDGYISQSDHSSNMMNMILPSRTCP